MLNLESARLCNHLYILFGKLEKIEHIDLWSLKLMSYFTYNTLKMQYSKIYVCRGHIDVFEGVYINRVEEASLYDYALNYIYRLCPLGGPVHTHWNDSQITIFFEIECLKE